MWRLHLTMSYIQHNKGLQVKLKDVFIEPFALHLRAFIIPRMRLWVCSLWCCWSTCWLIQTLPTLLSSQRLWPTRTCSTVSLFSTACTGKQQNSKVHSSAIKRFVQFWCFWVLTSGMELICFVERENSSLPKCSTSPTRHLDGSLANKYIYLQCCFVIHVFLQAHW